MQKIEIVFIPSTDAQLDAIRDLEVGTLPAQFLLCTLINSQYQYEHKLTLMNQGNDLQIVTKDANGTFTVADSDKTFPLNQPGHPVVMRLVDTFGDRSQYDLHLSEGPLEDANSQVVLYAHINPQLHIVEVTGTSGLDQNTILNFIGTEDIRPGIQQTRIIVPPGQKTQLSSENGDVTFKF